jgi:hypothetical protein
MHFVSLCHICFIALLPWVKVVIVVFPWYCHWCYFASSSLFTASVFRFLFVLSCYVAMPLCPATRCLARCCNVASYPPDINWMPCTIPQYPLKCSVFLCWWHLILPRCASLQANTLTGLLEKETGGRSTMATGLTFWWIISLMGRNISFDHLIWGKKYALPSGYST